MTLFGRGLAAAFLALLAPAFNAGAQDAGLYDQVADPDAAFVRVIAAPNSAVMVGTTSFADLADGVSPYVAVTGATETAVSAGGADAIVPVTAGSWQTYVVGSDGTATVVSDAVAASPAQAAVAFYNLTDLPAVDLFVPAAKAVAVGAVAPGRSGVVALKAPLTLDFEARAGETTLATVAAVALKRRDGVAFVLHGTAGSYSLVAVPNSVAQ
jgi:hypothetical protein